MAHRRPCLKRSSSGPMKGASRANGAIVRSRNWATWPRASSVGNGEDGPRQAHRQRGVAADVDEVQLDDPRQAALAGARRSGCRRAPGGPRPGCPVRPALPRRGCRARGPGLCARRPARQRRGRRPPARRRPGASVGPTRRRRLGSGWCGRRHQLASRRPGAGSGRRGQRLDQPVRDERVEAALALDRRRRTPLRARRAGPGPSLLAQHRQQRARAAGGRCRATPARAGRARCMPGRPGRLPGAQVGDGAVAAPGRRGRCRPGRRAPSRATLQRGVVARPPARSAAATVSSARVGDGAACASPADDPREDPADVGVDDGRALAEGEAWPPRPPCRRRRRAGRSSSASVRRDAPAVALGRSATAAACSRSARRG